MSAVQEINFMGIPSKFDIASDPSGPAATERSRCAQGGAQGTRAVAASGTVSGSPDQAAVWPLNDSFSRAAEVSLSQIIAGTPAVEIDLRRPEMSSGPLVASGSTVARPGRTVAEVKPGVEDLKCARRLFVASFLAVNWRQYEEHFLHDAFQEEVDAGSDRRWVFCRQGETLAGMCTFAVKIEDASLYVAQMAIAVGFQRSGVAKAIMNYIFTQVPEVGKAHLLVRPENKSGVALYEKLGFVKSEFMKEGYSRESYVGMTHNGPWGASLQNLRKRAL
jgi:ribosomal protein S18 acetylase RimI-like enzyme